MIEPFGQTLRELRERRGMSLRFLAKNAHCSHGHIADMENGRRHPGSTMAQLLDQILEAGGRLERLAPDSGDDNSFRIRSHKIVAGYIGDVVHQMRGDAQEVDSDGVSAHWALPLSHPSGSATLHLWGHGASIIHIVEEDDWPSITSWALWRYESYLRDLKWAQKQLKCDPAQPYVLSTYWVVKPAWNGVRLETALRLLCYPRLLVGENPAEISPDVEEALLHGGLPATDDIAEFGTPDTALGYASWSGVVYYPMDETRALHEQELVDMELSVQSRWQYCSWISNQVESGCDPSVPNEFGWRWLRANRSRLLMARPQETGPHRAMRESILYTSGLPGMLDTAISLLREDR